MNDRDDEPGLIGKIKDGFIQRKEARAERQHLITGSPDQARENRLPPGQRLVENWPVLDIGIQPQIAREAWALTIDGLVNNPQRWNWQTFMDQPVHNQICDIHCVTAWSRYDNKFTGVASSHILDMVQPADNVKHVIFHSYDGYTTNVTLDAFSAPDAMLAHSWNDEPLTRDHGGPARMVLPQWYFWKSAKWIKQIEFVAEDHPGFWEVRGYHNEGDPWNEDRYS